MSKTAVMAVAAMLLAAIIGFPLGMDQGIFVHCARVMHDGGTLYIDAYDIKPPAIHDMYALALWLPWQPEQSVRLFEFAWNLATCFFIWHAMLSWPATVRSMAVLAFAAILVAAGHPNTAQPETFAALPLTAMVWAMNRPDRIRLVVYGVAVGLLAALKPTMAVAVIPFAVHERVRTSLADVVRTVAIALAVISASIAPALLKPDGASALALMIQAQRAFASLFEVGDNIVWLGVTAFARWMFLSVGLPIVLAAIYAIRRHRSEPVVVTLAWTLLALAASVIVEHRFHPYHFLRMAAPMAMLAGIGAGHVTSKVHERWQAARLGQRMVIGTTVLLVLLATCLPLTAHKFMLGYGQLFGASTYTNYLSKRGYEGDDVLAFRSVAAVLNQRHSPRPVVVSVRAGLVLPWLDAARSTRASSAQFVTGTATPAEWTEAVRNDLASATLVAVDTADVVPMLTGHRLSSFGFVTTNPLFARVIESRFVPFDTVHTFVLMHAQP